MSYGRSFSCNDATRREGGGSVAGWFQTRTPRKSGSSPRHSLKQRLVSVLLDDTTPPVSPKPKIVSPTVVRLNPILPQAKSTSKRKTKITPEFGKLPSFSKLTSQSTGLSVFSPKSGRKLLAEEAPVTICVEKLRCVLHVGVSLLLVLRT